MSALHDRPGGVSRAASTEGHAPAQTGAASTAAYVASMPVVPAGAYAASMPVVPTYLDRIVPAVVRRLAERKRRRSQSELEAIVATDRGGSCAAALGGPEVSLIAEVKRSSPSKGPIRPDLEVGPLVEAYERSGARAVSVLTEEDFFGGNLEDLRVAAAHTRLPVLRKDFIVDPYQVHEARAYGASAVLLIAALLDDRLLEGLAALAGRLGLDVLLEVHDEAELARALAVEYAIVGINNRDLHSFEVSLDTTIRLAGLVPQGRLLVGESGIRDGDHVARLASSGVDGVLVGESILMSTDVGEAIAALMLPAPPVMLRPEGLTKMKEAR